MNRLSGSTTIAFSLLSIGQRGVSKTVFLAVRYAELHSDSQKNQTQECVFINADALVNDLAYLQALEELDELPYPAALRGRVSEDLPAGHVFDATLG